MYDHTGDLGDAFRLEHFEALVAADNVSGDLVPNDGIHIAKVVQGTPDLFIGGVARLEVLAGIVFCGFQQGNGHFLNVHFRAQRGGKSQAHQSFLPGSVICSACQKNASISRKFTREGAAVSWKPFAKIRAPLGGRGGWRAGTVAAAGRWGRRGAGRARGRGGRRSGGAGTGGRREAGRRGEPGTRARGRAAGRHSRARGGGAARQSPRRAHTGRVAGAAAGRGENGRRARAGRTARERGQISRGGRWRGRGETGRRARGRGGRAGRCRAHAGRARRRRGAGRRRKAASKLPACVGFPPAGKSAGRAGAVFAYKEARFPARLICLISAVSARKPCAFHRLAFLRPAE